MTVQVLAGPEGADPSSLSIENEQQLFLADQETVATTRFELQPKAVGKWQYMVKVIPLDGDADERDNASLAAVEVIERKNRVLIFAVDLRVSINSLAIFCIAIAMWNRTFCCKAATRAPAKSPKSCLIHFQPTARPLRSTMPSWRLMLIGTKCPTAPWSSRAMGG